MRLDQELVARGLVQSRSQAQKFIRLKKVFVDGKLATKAHMTTSSHVSIEIRGEKFVSRAGFKLASVSEKFKLDFRGKLVLDVGSSTGGFTDYALQQGAERVICVDVGTNQLHSSLRNDERIELHEKTDIRNFVMKDKPDIILIDLSFISLKEVLPHIAKLAGHKTEIIAMLKPQFEAGEKQKNKGVVKNSTVRRSIIKDFEAWSRKYFVIESKADSDVAGNKGNLERFFKLKQVQ